MNKLFRTIIESETSAKADIQTVNGIHGGSSAANTNQGSVAEENYIRVFVRDLKFEMLIGLLDHEKTEPQPVTVNIDAWLKNAHAGAGDELNDTVCYAGMVDTVLALAAKGHINLVEAFANQIADSILENVAVARVLVRVEKNTIIPGTHSVGVEILRSR